MKQLRRFSTILFSGALLLGACGQDGESDPNREDATIGHEEEEAGGSMEHGAGYGFTSFELEIDLDGKDAIDASYEVSDRTEVEYVNRIANENLRGQEAMQRLDALFSAKWFNNNTPREEFIQRITEFYKVRDYSKFELEIVFDDGTRVDIKDVK